MKKLLSTILNGVTEIRFHIFRSLLSLVGIVLGVLNLTAMFSIVDGARQANQSVIESLGTPDMVSIWLDRRKVVTAEDRKAYRLDWSDYDNLKNDAQTIKAIGVEISTREVTLYGNKSKNYQILGVIPATFAMNSYKIERGRQLTAFDEDTGEKVCVIGSDVVNFFFTNEDPLGRAVKIRDEYFRVVGVLIEFGGEYAGKGKNNPLAWKNERILIPARTMQSRFTGLRAWFSLFVQSKSIDLVPKTVDEVNAILVRTHNNRDVFTIQSMMERQGSMEDFARIWQIVLGVVAGISLLVGGVGIMNVMLASFTERMREIGIRKALGATNLDIFMLFLVETVVICMIGGLIGLVIGYFVSTTAVNQMTSQTFNTSAKFSFGSGIFSILFSMVIGVLSGIYPAIKASKLAPVEALRYE